VKTIVLLLSLLLANEVFSDSTEEDNSLSRKGPEYQQPNQLLGWIDARSKQALNGTWHYIVDHMDNGLPESIFGGFPKNKTQIDGMELIEYNFEKAKQINIPGAWNTQDDSLFFYRGS
ncbi:uncharacterized protein METZ01_LOCUS507846, partial [marine metagenome]